MSMKHSNRINLHERLIRMYTVELQDNTMDPEVRNQITKKLISTMNLKTRLINHLEKIKSK
jgi:hypothetical protein